MSKKLLIVVGTSCAGKTTFAKQYARENQGIYLNFDVLFDYQAKTSDFEKLANKLQSLIQDSGKILFVLDGFIAMGNTPLTIASLQNKLGIDVQLCLCFAAPHIVHQRQRYKAQDLLRSAPITKEVITDTTESLFFTLVSIDDNPILVDTTHSTSEVIDLKTFPQRWRELLFLSSLDKMPHDRYYQDIELPSGIYMKGYSDSAKTWERLSSIINFSGRTVLDMGCFHGFFSFKVEEAGARTVVGTDKDDRAIQIARLISWLKNSKVSFQQSNIENLVLEQVYDIVLVLNMLHYTTKIDTALQNIFRSGNLIVFEIPVEQRDIISKWAAQAGFQLATETGSHRSERIILTFKNPQSTTNLTETPQKYKFSKTHYKFQSFVQAIKNLKIVYPIKYIVRKYRQHHRGKTNSNAS